ncbi:hypothetical protein LTR22_021200 [Elasticomyces elasticus]|nr:hypothetical protein LTR22_021200 [Elasticomyces elasticus]
MVPHVKEGGALRDSMSSLSPKRRRTTGNLKTVTIGSVNDNTPRTPRATSPGARTPGSERPPPTTPTARPTSEPVQGGGVPASPGFESDGNLFYAYARRGDDLHSRYLLTFASASIANEWWSHLQTHFPETSRPGPQLFSFKDPPDLLPRAWKHPAFASLKSKWMYISFSDTQENGLGGAAQGIIPVQDAAGNLVGNTGLVPASPEQVGREVRKETKGVRNGLSKMEEHFDRMMEAVERNTAQIAVLAERQFEQAQTSRAKDEERNGYFESDNITTYLARINDLLAQHSESMQGLAKKQTETDQKLQSALEDVAGRQRNDYLDMSQLSSHLDRVQSLMERSVSDRTDSAKEVSEQQQLFKPEIDFSPLTDRLEKVQEAVEQNSALVKALLDEGTAESRPGTPFWGKDAALQQQQDHNQQQKVDLTPLAEHLQKIHEAIEQQNSHMQMLVGFASGDGETDPLGSPGLTRASLAGPGDTAEKSLAPLGEHLEQIFNAIEEGNAHAKKVGGIDLQPLMEKMEAMRVATETSNKLDLTPLLEKMEAMRAAVEAGGKLDLTPLTDKMEATRAAVEAGSSKLDLTSLVDKIEATRAAVETNGKKDVDLAPLQDHFGGFAEHLKSISSASERGNEQMGILLTAHGELQKAVVANGQRPAPVVDLDPLIEKIEDMRAAVETTLSVDIVPLAEKFNDIIERLGTIGISSEKGNEQLGKVLEAHKLLREAVADNKMEPVNLGPLVVKMDEVRETVEATPIVDFAPLIASFETLDSHFGTVSSSLEQQSEALQLLLEAQDRMSAVVTEGGISRATDLEPLAEKFDTLAEHLKGINILSHSHNDSLGQLLQAHDGLSRAITDNRTSLDLTPLAEKFDGMNEHLECLREWAEYDSEHLKELLESQKAMSKATATGAGKAINLAPLTGKFDALGEHLAAIRSATEEHTGSLRALLEAQQSAPNFALPEIDLTPLTDRLSRIQESLQRQTERGDKVPGSGDAKFVMSALSSHLSKIQAVTEANAQHVKALREKQSATQEKMHISVASTSDAIATLNRHTSAEQDRTDERVDSLNGQVRELMAGQREMVEVMRSLAMSLTAQNKESCDHIVVPPPRKMGRKVVGFVYDAKDGPVNVPMRPEMKARDSDYWKGL